MHLYKSTVIKMSKIFFYHNYKRSFNVFAVMAINNFNNAKRNAEPTSCFFKKRVTSTKKKAYNVSTLENNFKSSLTH